MKKSLILFVFLMSIAVEARTKEIIAEVVFENTTDAPITSGTFFITELDKEIEITSAESFSITLPEKGKYQFGFYSEDFTSYTYYPAKITSKKNIITIRLEQKPATETALNYRNLANPEDLGVGMNFIFNGINQKPVDFSEFSEKYVVGAVSKNCTVDPVLMKRVTAHNQKVANYLTKNFGEQWKEDLPATPFGLKAK
ncbi:FEKKY domain-containing protein [Zunongwangia atlantica]|uniref:DUF4369 domain-containing protein n=1 Tax=Zunongwangia atlantica 22II14-10F7 TaxID=1185767 RepID=A0A1Y1T7N4_9FLAO|nr:hypothetical protein [Zunongwangia atlantica]ORL47077.1 hypothetical protein IIF7_03636 [Zunongwangia atlantica 22II14-10F7]